MTRRLAGSKVSRKGRSASRPRSMGAPFSACVRKSVGTPRRTSGPTLTVAARTRREETWPPAMSRAPARGGGFAAGPGRDPAGKAFLPPARRQAAQAADLYAAPARLDLDARLAR